MTATHYSTPTCVVTAPSTGNLEPIPNPGRVNRPAPPSGGGRTASWLLAFLLVPGTGFFGQAPATEALEAMRIHHPPVIGGRLSGAAWDGQAWVVIGGRGTILRSVDGLEWQPQAANAQPCIRNVTSGNGMWLALTHCSVALTSCDGFRWEPRESPGLAVRSAAFGAGVFVAVGDSGTIMVSADAAVWTPAVMDSSDGLVCVRYAADRFVAAGARGAILSSTNGRQWTRHESRTTHCLRGLAHGAGSWVAVGRHGAILSSADGEHWTPLESGTEESLHAVAFGGDTFLAVGRNGCALVSRDACEWRPFPLGGANLHDVAYGRGRFVAVGEHDTILLVGRVYQAMLRPTPCCPVRIARLILPEKGNEL